MKLTTTIFKQTLSPKIFLITLVPLVLAACNIPTQYISNTSFLIDYTKDSTASEQLKYHITHAKTKGLTIVELGDSHSAADLMTGMMRRKLQEIYGQGNLGFIEPLSVPGQANLVMNYNNEGADLFNARNDPDKDYQFGGLIGDLQPDTSVTYTPYRQTLPRSNMQVLARCTDNSICTYNLSSNLGTSQEIALGHDWHFYNVQVDGKFTITSDNDLEVAGYFLPNQGTGVTLSALGSNGATIAYLDNWKSDWVQQMNVLQPQLVILSYGTNESYQTNFDAKQYYRDYTTLIKRIRKYTHAQIMIMSNPDSLNLDINPKLANNSCKGKQHDNVALVHQTLQKIAYNNHTLFWDWRQAMGGACSMLRYVAQEQARADGVHFTRQSYDYFGKKLAQDLISYATPLNINTAKR